MQLTTEDIHQLSAQQRLSLIAQLWDSLEESDTPLTPAQEAELERRLATLDQDRARAVTWEQLTAELERQNP